MPQAARVGTVGVCSWVLIAGVGAPAALAQSDPNRPASVTEAPPGVPRDGTPSVSAGEAKARDRELAEALELIRAGDYQTAIERLGRHIEAMPSDAEAKFLAGVALNRAGDPQRAYRLLRDAELGGSVNPRLDLEIGWATLRIGALADAVERLERHTAASPGEAHAFDLLGRAYLGQGRVDEAERAFGTARALGTPAPSAALGQGLAAAQRGDADSAEEAFARVSLDRPATQIGTLAERYLSASDGPGLSGYASTKPVPVRITLLAASGYNSNVIAIGNSVPLPADISDESSATGTFGATIEFDAYKDRDTAVIAGYSFRGDVYEGGLQQANAVDHLAYVDVQRRLHEDVIGSLRASFQDTLIGGDELRQLWTLRPALTFRVLEWMTLESAYTVRISDFRFPSAPASDRDGATHTAGVTLGFRPPRTELIVQAGYFHDFVVSEGTDFDGDADAVFASLSHPLPLGVTGSLAYTHVFSRYDNPNSFAPAGETRDDEIDVVSAELGRPYELPGGLRGRVFVRYDFVNNDSNLAVFDYDQHVVLFGTTISW